MATARSLALRSIRSSTQPRYPMAHSSSRGHRLRNRVIHDARYPPRWPVPGLVCAKLRYRTATEHVEHVLIVGTSMPIRIAWRIRGEVKAVAASSQVSEYMVAVCKTVGFGYPGSNPGPATTSENSLLISPCSGEELALGCPVASGGNRPATVGPGEYVAKSHTMAVVWPRHRGRHGASASG